MPRRPSKLEDPPPGSRCPACWLDIAFLPGTANVCPRCFALVACVAFGAGHAPRMSRLVPSDLTRMQPAHRAALLGTRQQMVEAAANRWRQPPTPSRPLQAR